MNGNGQDDAGEPGVSGIVVQLNEKRSVKTDVNGRYDFSANEGSYNIMLVSSDLGVRLRATTNTQQKVSVFARESVKVNFGVTNLGFLSGRIFNDLSLTGEYSTDARGIGGVWILLHSAKGDLKQITQSSGKYEFQNLPPGEYTLEIDAASLPPNFRLPEQATRQIRVEPLQGFYLDLPINAQRAVSGVVYVDSNGNGKYDLLFDELVPNATVTSGTSSAVSGARGEYLLRNLPAGKIKIVARTSVGTESTSALSVLEAEPVTKDAVNIAVR